MTVTSQEIASCVESLEYSNFEDHLYMSWLESDCDPEFCGSDYEVLC